MSAHPQLPEGAVVLTDYERECVQSWGEQVSKNLPIWWDDDDAALLAKLSSSASGKEEGDG